MGMGQLNAVNTGSSPSGVSTSFAMYAFKQAAETQRKSILMLVQSMQIPEEQKKNLINLLA